MEKAFLTGSRCYGKPSSSSDFDLVVRMTPKTYRKLAKASEGKGSDIPGKNESLRFGQLNLICCIDDSTFEVWRQGTRELESRKPVTRDEAIAFFQNLRETVGLL